MRLRTPGGSDGGFSWQARTSPAGPQTGRAVAVGVVASEEHGTPGALCCFSLQLLEGRRVRDRSAASVGGALRPPRPRRVPCSRRSAGSGRTGRRPALVGPFLLHPSERTLFLCLTGGRHRFIAWARSATEGGSPAAARVGRGGGALAGGGTARGRAPRGARQPDVRGTVACVPRRPPSEPWTPRALPFNVTQREVSS